MTSSRNFSDGSEASPLFLSAADSARRLVAAAGLGNVTDLRSLPGGRNNRGFQVTAGGCAYFLKCFFRHPDDPRDRFGAERAFLEYAAAGDVIAVPRLLAVDERAGALLCEFVDGRGPTPGTIGPRHVDAALDLMQALARGRNSHEADRLPAASEACFSLKDHIAIVDRRMQHLQAIADRDDVAHAALGFLQARLQPCWRSMRAGVLAQGRRHPVLAGPLDRGQRIVSPSDFGFHNAIEAPDGRLTFIDFEYAGWDDPAKLVGDFFAQPAVPVPEAFYPGFRDAVCHLAADPQPMRQRCDLLRPLHRLKWCGILLNEFLPVDGRRRAFANGAQNDPRPGQLVKAERLLTAIEDGF